MMMFGMNEGLYGNDSKEINFGKNLATLYNIINISQSYMAGLSKYANDFAIPYLISTSYFNQVERNKLSSTSILESLTSYMELWNFSFDLFSRGFNASLRAMSDFGQVEAGKFVDALFRTYLREEGEDIEAFTARQAHLIDLVVNEYAKAIQDIESEFGFHFDKGNNVKIAETDRFILYQILPTKEKTEVNKKGKPVLIIPPFVLGANILAFLPSENRSYAHCFANQGIPTYIRILKDIRTTEALQIMTGEDDANDTRVFCEKVKARHGKPVTLNGYCQGGFSAVCNLLSGALDGLVDALITCVSPIDGTRSEGLSGFLNSLPQRFNDLAYGTKTLANGNKVADGKLMGWIYKLKSIEDEAPIVAFYRDFMMFARQGEKEKKISKTAAAINHWLINERFDLPLEITKMSYASYNTPITKDGTLPVKLFDRNLNFKRLKAKNIKWLICYGENDDLVEKDTALAPLNYIDAEVTPFPKGHVAIATSWSHPDSACALHTRFGNQGFRGPVRYQLDLDQEIDRNIAKPATGKRNSDAQSHKGKNLL
ncbi:MAG: metal transporter [Desulfobacterales bacterium]|nr:MAG: metal transporter [Desulfobacterales bacterium]